MATNVHRSVEITVGLTALSSAGRTWLDSFDAGYDAAIGGWSAEIAAALGRLDA